MDSSNTDTTTTAEYWAPWEILKETLYHLQDTEDPRVAAEFLIENRFYQLSREKRMVAAFYPAGVDIEELMMREDPSSQLRRLLPHMRVEHYIRHVSPARLYANRDVFHHYRQLGGMPFPRTAWAKEAWGAPKDLDASCSYCGEPAMFGGLMACIRCMDVVANLDIFMKSPNGRKFILQQIGRPGLEDIYTILEHERRLTEGQSEEE